MTKKRTLWLVLIIGAAAVAAAIMLLCGGSEQKAHEGARFVWAQECRQLS